jgi:DNA-binding MarR family transcriptional regulator
MTDKMEPIAELICELTRNCNIKEEYFASSFNLSPTEVRFLKLFAVSSSYTIKELRELLKLTPGRITHILTSLEDKKLISRHQDEKDKRVILVKLMPKASPLISNLHQNYSELHNRIMQNVKQDEIENIYNSLEILVDVFRKWVNQR